ncbi:hypothetical protein [Klebsiella variicola]|uniref:hypothetical protein n=1 Tax=Klebsiella variicola TaxID=244366 RepID=UPI001F41B187|nr:hypothetical protein [Klebsiella variicola]
MAELNPPLGTTTPEIFLDNVKRADELVNGPAGTINDRSGEPLDTWRQMMAKNDEVRQNLIPLSKQYATLAAAQADIANIPVGSTTYYRSPDDSALAVEVMNVSGTLQPTGRKMPSQAELDKIAHALEESVEITKTLSRLTLTEALSLTASGSWSLSDEAVGQLRTASLPAGGDTSAKLVLTAGTNEFFSRDFFPGETLTDGDITTHFNPLYLKEMTVSNVIVEANVLRAAFFPVVGDGVVATSQYTAFDPEHDFASIRADQGSTTALRGVVLHSSGTYLQVTIPRTELSAAGYPATPAGVQAYLQSMWPEKVFYYASTTTQVIHTASLFSVPPGTLTVDASTGLVFAFSVMNSGEMNQVPEVLHSNAVSAAVAKDLALNGRYSRLVYNGPLLGLPGYSDKNRLVVIDTIQSTSADDNQYAPRMVDLAFSVNGMRVGRRIVPANQSLLQNGILQGFSEAHRLNELKGVEIRYTDGVSVTSTSWFPGAVMVIAKFIRKDGAVWTLTNTGVPGCVDLAGQFSYVTGNESALLRTDIVTSLGGYKGNGCLQFSVPVTLLDAAGVPLFSPSAIFNYLYGLSRNSVFTYRTASWQITRDLQDIMALRVPAGALSIEHLNSSGDRNGIILRVYEEDAVNGADVGDYVRVTGDVKNATTQDYLNYPVELKVRFPAGKVPSQECLVLTDENGLEYDCQFSGTEHPNPRQRSQPGFHPDGSLAAGSVFTLASVPAGETRFFELKAYATARKSYAESPLLTVPSATQRTVTLDGYTMAFTNSGVVAAGAWALASITDPNGTVHNITLNAYLSGSTWASGAYQEAGFQGASSIRLINTGPVFVEIEVVSWNLPIDNVPSQAVRAVMRYRLFRNGKLQIRLVSSMEVALPVSTLSGVIARLTFGDGAYPYDPQAASVIFTDPTSGDKWAVTAVRANGDVHRDGHTYGPTRPTMLEVRNPSSSSVRLYAGWKYQTQDHNSFITWPVNKGWAWTSEFWFDMRSPSATARDVFSRVLNRPVGFLGQSSYPSTQVRRALCEIELHLDGSMDWWYSGDARQWEGGPGDTRTFKYAPVTYEIVRYLKDGLGTLEGIYTQLETVVKSFGVPVLANIGASYLNGGHLLQFASRISVPVLHWLYKVAVLKGNTTVRDKTAVAIKSFADAIVTYYNANGGVGLQGSVAGKGNSNSNATGLRIVALGIMSGQDAAGAYLATYNGIQSLLMQSSGFMYAQNILKEGASDVLSANWWVHYQVFAYNNYLLGCTAAGRESAFDMDNFILMSSSALGGFDEIDYCASESRRGSFNTITFAAYPMMISGRPSMMNALLTSLDLFNSEYGPQSGLPKRYFGFDGYQAGSTVATTDIPFCATTFSDVWLDQYFRQRQLG